MFEQLAVGVAVNCFGSLFWECSKSVGTYAFKKYKENKEKRKRAEINEKNKKKKPMKRQLTPRKRNMGTRVSKKETQNKEAQKNKLLYEQIKNASRSEEPCKNELFVTVKTKGVFMTLV